MRLPSVLNLVKNVGERKLMSGTTRISRNKGTVLNWSQTVKNANELVWLTPLNGSEAFSASGHKTEKTYFTITKYFKLQELKQDIPF